jgi:hypothetical protein
MTSPATPQAHLSRSGAFFFFFPDLLLGAAGLGWIVMIRAALNDPGFAIEPDYYRKASGIDAEKELRAQSAELGWTAKIDSFELTPSGQGELVVHLTGERGEALNDLSVDASAFFNARANERRSLHLTAVGAGLYRTSLGPAHPGLWEIRLVAHGTDGAFHETFRHELSLAKSVRGGKAR